MAPQSDALEENRCDGVLRSFGLRQRRAPADEVGAFFSHHQYAGVDVCGDEIWHRRSITDAQAFDAMHFEIRVQYSILPDRAGASGMMGGDDDLFDPSVDGSIRIHRKARIYLLVAIRIHCLLEGDLARTFKSFAQGRQIVRRGEEAIDDARGGQRIGRAEQQLAATIGMEQRWSYTKA